MRELDRVIGYEGIKNELYRIIDIIKNPAKYKKLGVSVPKGILLSGDPGIGKTLMAKSFIKETGLEKFVIRKDRPDGEFIDYIRETFEKAAEKAPCIILLDDLDKFANEDNYHRDAEEYVTVQSCIDDVKEIDVIVLATCNDYRKLPDSLVRSGRFDKRFFMDFPGYEDAKKIIAFYLKDKKVSEDIDVEEIARFSEGHSCADIEMVLNEAGIYAGYEDKKHISQEDIKTAIINKIFHGSETEECDSTSNLRLAVHEAGHAAVSELFFPGQVAFVSIDARSCGVRGMVLRSKDPHLFDCFNNLEVEIMINLAGKAATELILNEIDTGTSEDINNAYRHLGKMLDDVASYDFLSWSDYREASNNILDHLDQAKSVEIARYYVKTKQLLGKNRAFLEELIDLLIEKKTISYKDIAPVREKYVPDHGAAA